MSIQSKEFTRQSLDPVACCSVPNLSCHRYTKARSMMIVQIEFSDKMLILSFLASSGKSDVILAL